MFQSEEDELSSVRMDIALLKEQYNSIRDKQRRQTQVLCFKEGKKSCLDLCPADRECSGNFGKVMNKHSSIELSGYSGL